MEQIFMNVPVKKLESTFKKWLNDELSKLAEQFQPKEPEEFLTREEVTKLLKIDLSTLWAWTKKGKLQSYGIGNRVYYKRSEVESAIKPLN